MITQTITLPIVSVPFLMIAAAAVGYAIRGGQRLKMRKLIDELETAQHAANSRILELEKETLDLETRLREWQSPVIPLKKPATTASEESNPKIAPRDMNLRKQLLGKDDKNRHSASR